MPIGYSGAPRVTQNNMDSRLRRLSRSLTTGNNGTPLRTTLFSSEKFQYEASPDAANTNARRPVMDIFSAEFKDADGAVVNSCVTAGFWNDCGFLELRCAADNSLVWGVNNTFGGGPGAIVYMGSTGFMKADNTAFSYNETLEQMKIYQNTANTTPMFCIEQDGTGHALYTALLTGTQGYTWGANPIFGTNYFMLTTGNTGATVFGEIINTAALIVNPDAAVGIGALPTTDNERLKVRPHNNTTSSSYATVLIETPNKTVSSNQSNLLIGFQATGGPKTYDISSGITDSGSREGIRFEEFAGNTNFEGTLTKQIAGFFRHGINVGTGTISNSVGILVELLEDTGTITQSWGIFQKSASSDNFFAGNTLFSPVATPGATAPIHTYRNNGDTTPQVKIEQDSTGDATLNWLLTSTQGYVAGIDNSDSDKFKICAGNTIGSSCAIDIATDNTVTITTQSFPIAEVNVNTTLNATHHTLLVNTNSADRVVTLPAASGATGRIYRVKKIDSATNTITVDGNGAETIDGSANTVISSQWDSVTLQSDGTSWFIL